MPGFDIATTEGRFTPYRPVGCLDCRMTGFRGRSGLFELLTLDEAVRQAVREVPDLLRIRHHAIKEGLQPLRLAGLRKIAAGETTLDEVLRATPAFDLN
jgi:general secretion pathway protein E